MKIEKSKTLIRSFISKYKLEPLLSDDILDLLELHIYENGEFLSIAGEISVFVSLFVEGEAKVVPSSENGKIVLINYLSPTDMFGEIELLLKCNYIDSVVAIGHATLLSIPVETVNSKLINSIPFLQFLCTSLTKKLVAHSNNYSRSMLYRKKNHLSRYLVNLSEAMHTNVVPFVTAEVSQYLGITDRHLRRLLTEYVEEGVLERNSKEVKILDLPKLKQDCPYL